MKIRITETQLKTLFLVEEQNEMCYKDHEFLLGAINIIKNDDYELLKSEESNYGCKITFRKKIGEYNTTIEIFWDGFIEVINDHPKKDRVVYTSGDVRLKSKDELSINNFAKISKDGKGGSPLKLVNSWTNLNNFLNEMGTKKSPTSNENNIKEDVKELEDLLLWNVDDNDFIKIDKILRKYLSNKKSFCALGYEYYLQTGDELYEEIGDVGIGDQRLVRELVSDISEKEKSWGVC